MTELALMLRYLSSKRTFMNVSTLLSVVGITLGVGTLVVTMSVFSGYEQTLRNTVVNTLGHLVIIHRGGVKSQSSQDWLNELKPLILGFKAATPFVHAEAVLAHNQKLAGVLIEGVDDQKVSKVLKLEPRLIHGEFDLSTNSGVPGALVGKGLFKKFDLQVGDVIRLVMPVSDPYDRAQFKSRLAKFRVQGVLDLGHEDYDSRFVIIHISSAQEFAGMGQRVTGYRLRLDNDESALASSRNILNEHGFNYWVRDWRDMNSNLFAAVKLEKIVVFLVLLTMIIAASFNVSSSLFVSVMKRYRDISILKTLGASNGFVRRLFAVQGLLIGAVGSAMGFLLGLLASYGFLWAHEKWGLLPSEVYKLDHVDIAWRWQDFSLVILFTTIICFLATLSPARRGSKLSPVEGLRYE